MINTWPPPTPAIVRERFSPSDGNLLRRTSSPARALLPSPVNALSPNGSHLPHNRAHSLLMMQHRQELRQEHARGHTQRQAHAQGLVQDRPFHGEIPLELGVDAPRYTRSPIADGDISSINSVRPCSDLTGRAISHPDSHSHSPLSPFLSSPITAPLSLSPSIRSVALETDDPQQCAINQHTHAHTHALSSPQERYHYITPQHGNLPLNLSSPLHAQSMGHDGLIGSPHDSHSFSSSPFTRFSRAKNTHTATATAAATARSAANGNCFAPQPEAGVEVAHPNPDPSCTPRHASTGAAPSSSHSVVRSPSSSPSSHSHSQSQSPQAALSVFAPFCFGAFPPPISS